MRVIIKNEILKTSKIYKSNKNELKPRKIKINKNTGLQTNKWRKFKKWHFSIVNSSIWADQPF